MSRRPLFSTYRQGENRVTGSMIAVFERLDLATLRTILATASDDADLELVRFELQPTATGTQTIPDARISGPLTTSSNRRSPMTRSAMQIRS